ncbi:MAG: Aspartate-semialdehyde dehydrogenase, partial [uncultured Thermomicrobiales bacterium]
EGSTWQDPGRRARRDRCGGAALRPAPGRAPLVRPGGGCGFGARGGAALRGGRRVAPAGRRPRGGAGADRARAGRCVDEPDSLLSPPGRCRGRGRGAAGGRRARRLQQRAQPPDGAGRAADRAGDQRRSRRGPGPAAARAGLVGHAGDESELLDDPSRAGVGAAPTHLWPRSGARDHPPGCLRRRLPRRPLARHARQCRPPHRGRGGEDGDRDAQDPRRVRGGRGARLRRCRGGRQRHLHPRPRARRPHRGGLGGARAPSRGRRGRRGAARVRRPPPGPRRAERAAASGGRPRRARPPAAGSRPRPRARHGDRRRPAAPLPDSRLEVRPPRPQHHPRRRRRLDPQRRDDAGAGVPARIAGSRRGAKH